MRFWPFGKEKEPVVDDNDFVSRVVTGAAADGGVLRAKLTVHFQDPLSTSEADPIADEAATLMRAVFAGEPSATGALGTEAQLAKEVAAKLTSAKVRSVDLVALHVVGEAPASTAASPPPASRAAPSSAPPPGHRRSSSSQLLAVRDSRLIPEGATPEAAAYAIIPLLKDASTRVLVGMLRGLDLVVVRGMRVEGTDADTLSGLVPQSTAMPGHFADERADELHRWHDKLGEEKLASLRTEASAVVCYFLHTSLEKTGVDMSTSTSLLEAAARGAFEQEAPLSAMPHYLGAASDPTDALAVRTLDILGEPHEALASLSLMLTPVLASLQEDFAFTSGQIKLSVVPP